MIYWEIVERIERLDGDWAAYAIEGYDDDGNLWYGDMESYISDPQIIEDNITNIEPA